MNQRSADFKIDAKDYAKFYAAVKHLDKDVAKQLRKNMRKMAKPILEEVKQAALNLPSQQTEMVDSAGGHQVGLREGIARAAETKIRTTGKNGLNVRIRISGTKFNQATGKPRKIPRYVEGFSRKPWRHPVFADKGADRGSWQGKWAEQKSTPFLFKTVFPHKDQFRKVVFESFKTAVSTARMSSK